MPSDFATFHHHFNGTTWRACASCGGLCESDTIAILMPGEVIAEPPWPGSKYEVLAEPVMQEDSNDTRKPDSRD